MADFPAGGDAAVVSQEELARVGSFGCVKGTCGYVTVLVYVHNRASLQGVDVHCRDLPSLDWACEDAYSSESQCEAKNLHGHCARNCRLSLSLFRLLFSEVTLAVGGILARSPFIALCRACSTRRGNFRVRPRNSLSRRPLSGLPRMQCIFLEPELKLQTVCMNAFQGSIVIGPTIITSMTGPNVGLSPKRASR